MDSIQKKKLGKSKTTLAHPPPRTMPRPRKLATQIPALANDVACLFGANGIDDREHEFTVLDVEEGQVALKVDDILPKLRLAFRTRECRNLVKPLTAQSAICLLRQILHVVDYSLAYRKRTVRRQGKETSILIYRIVPAPRE